MSLGWPRSCAGVRNRAALWGFVAVAASLLTLSLYYVLNGQLNADEGFYLLASSLVREGIRPYQNFGFTQGPVLPYANVPWLELFGYTLDGERLASWAWAVITVACGSVWLGRRNGWFCALLFAAALLGAPNWVAFVVKGKTYAFAGLCVLVGAIALISEWRLRVRWGLFALAAACGVGARFPMAAFFFAGGSCLLALTPGWKARFLAVGFVTSVAVVVLVLSAGGCWDNFLFWTTQFHQASMFHFSWVKRFGTCARIAPAAWVFSAAAMIHFSRRGARLPQLTLGALTFAVLANLSFPTAYAEYIIPFIPAAVAVAVPAVAPMLTGGRRAFLAILTMAALAIGWVAPPALDRNILNHAAEAAEFLRSNISAGATVVASMPEIPVAAGMRVPLSLAMGKFSLTDDFGSAVASRRMMVTPTMLTELVADSNTRAIVLSDGFRWNFFWSVPSYQPLADQERSRIGATIGRHFKLAFWNENYLVYLRKTDVAQ